MRKINLQHMAAGFTTVLVGYTSSVVLIIQAATVVGASPDQIESWLLALGLAMGFTSIGFSWWFKTPILTAWSTPGAAILISTLNDFSLATTIGCFVVSGGLIMLTGMIRPLSSALERIPPALGTAMLGAILLPFCVNAFEPLATNPYIFGSMFCALLVAKRYLPLLSMGIILLIGIAYSIAIGAFDGLNIDASIAQPVWVSPQFDLTAIINISVPLYLVTMLSQNLPGIAMMQSHQYRAPVKPLLIGTGFTNMLCAPFGGFSLNLAAITAAICMGEEVDEDKSQRYRAALWAGLFYVIAGLWATGIVSVFLALPKDVSVMLAGFALLGTLLMCFQSAFQDPLYRESAMLTFLVTLSGAAFLGMSSTLWGLLVGGAHLRFIQNASNAQ